MRRLYAFIDRSFDTRAQRAMQAYRQDDAYQTNAHHYRLADYGLSEGRIDALFGAYMAHYGLGKGR